MKLDIMIDNQRVVRVKAKKVTSEGSKYLVLDIENTGKLLCAWQELDTGRRRYGWSGNHDYEDLMIAWHTDHSGQVLEWVSAFWDGRQDWDAHSLEAIAQALPADCLEWEKVAA